MEKYFGSIPLNSRERQDLCKASATRAQAQGLAKENNFKKRK